MEGVRQKRKGEGGGRSMDRAFSNRPELGAKTALDLPSR